MGVLSPLVDSKKSDSGLVKDAQPNNGWFNRSSACPYLINPVDLDLVKEAQPNRGWYNQKSACPAVLQKQKELEVSAVANGTTTILMSDIPLQMSVEHVIDMIIDHGFADTYNFVHMPPSTGETPAGLGHVYINFKTAEFASDFLGIFQRFVYSHGNSRSLIRAKLIDGQCYIMSDIPSEVTVDQIISVIDEHGFAETYDFVYMPTEDNSRESHGYALINFKTAEFAENFLCIFENFFFPDCNSTKLSHTKLADSQCCIAHDLPREVTVN